MSMAKGLVASRSEPKSGSASGLLRKARAAAPETAAAESGPTRHYPIDIKRVPLYPPDRAKTSGGQSSATAPSGSTPTPSPRPTAGGQPLDSNTREYFEPRLGLDLGAVRIHHDAAAVDSARALGARAYTAGQNIFFGGREYAPEKPSGRLLLAHELVHVAQNAVRESPRPGAVTSARGAAETEADTLANLLVQGHAVTARAMPDGDIARAPLPPAVQKVVDKFYNRVPSQPPVQLKTSAADLLSALGGLSKGDQDLAISNAGTDRIELLLNTADPPDLSANAGLTSRLKGELVARKMKGMTGQLYWAGESTPDSSAGYQPSTQTARPDQNPDPTQPIKYNDNDFAVWIRGGAEPSSTGGMNCWEAILFGAFKAGVLTITQLRATYNKAAAAGKAGEAAAGPATTYIDPASMGIDAYNQALEKYLHKDIAKPMTATDEPRRGDLVFFNGLTHVALSLGSRVNAQGRRVHDVMSLWIAPLRAGKLVDTLQQTTVEDLLASSPSTLAPVTFAAGPW